MPIYKYKGLNKSGKEIKATLNSESISQAKQKLKIMGIMLVEIKEEKSDSLKHVSTINFANKISITDLSLMTRQLATLIKAKVQIVEALSALLDQADNQQMKLVLSDVKQKVNEGSSLAKAFSDYPTIFNNIYVNMVDAGETSGNLSIVLLKLAEFTDNQVKLKNKIKSAMTYPVIMMVIGSIMMTLIFMFVIPQITKIFASMKKELPIQTKISIWISEFLRNHWLFIIISLFASYYLFKKYINSKNGQEKWHSLLLMLPIINDLTIMINVSRFTSILSTLLNSGVPILDAMKIVKNLISNVHIQKTVEDARISIAEGATLAGPLTKSGLFPPMVTHMIGIGEKSGELEPMLNIISETYEDEVNTKLSGLTSILEPIMLVIMGLVIGFIIFSVVVPMLDMSSLKR